MKSIWIGLLLSALATPSFSGCPANPPWAPSNLQPGDQKVTASWLQANLAGKSVVYDAGRETYRPDGSYLYRADGTNHQAPSYKFYNNGVRCIGYATPRFDYYVVNDGKLILGNASGQRFVGRLAY